MSEIGKVGKMKQKEIISQYHKRPDYLRVVDILKNRINRREIKPGENFRTESFLSTEFNVSQNSAKNALSILINEGYVCNIPGKGNFVCEKVFKPFVLDFDEVMRDNQKRHLIKNVGIDIIKADHEIGRELEILENSNVIVIKRTYSNEYQMLVFEEKYIPYKRGKPIIESNFDSLQFQENVSQKILLQATTKKLNIKAQVATEKMSRILNIKVGEAVLVVEQKQFDVKDKPIEMSFLYFSEAENFALKAVTSIF